MARRTRRTLIHEELTQSLIGAFYEVYNTLGFGFKEHIYSLGLERDLRSRGHRVGREVSVIVFYKGEELGRQRIDLIVDETLVVEIKSTFDLRHGVRDQLYNYLHATRPGTRPSAPLRASTKVLSRDLDQQVRRIRRLRCFRRIR